MKTPPPLATWRFTFLASLGLLSACGGNTEGNSTSGGAGGTPTTSGGQGGASSGGMSSGGMSTGGMHTGGTSTGGTGTGGARAACEMSTPILNPDGTSTGFEKCSDGLVHRPDALNCANELPRSDVTFGEGWTGECKSDADCTAKPYGYCSPSSGGQVPVTTCRYGCITDADCPSGNLCECGPTFGVCTPTNCVTDADCGGGLCAKNADPGPCADGDLGSSNRFACTTEFDSCRVHSDCMTMRCAYLDGARACAPFSVCGIGRPFLVDGEARVASLSHGSDWLPSEAVSDATPNRLAADHYQRAALLEHASIAAFARFTLELLALGAPAELVEAATSAMADETLHARLCFGLASRFGGAAIAPGPLAVADALGSIDLERILANVVLEGCVGESVAAEEASRSLEFVRDAEVECVLTRIFDDERSHAELAFRFLEWALTRRPELARGVREVVRRAVETADAGAASDDALTAAERHALKYGVFPGAWRSALRNTVLREFVMPCVEALCARHSSRPNLGADAITNDCRPS